MKSFLATAVAATLLALALDLPAQSPAPAPAPGIKRTILQRGDIGNNIEVVLGRAEIPAGASSGRHTHFGTETGMLLEGSMSLEIDGEPPRLVNAGDSFLIGAGKVHNAKVVGDVPAKVISTYVVEKGKPLASPAP
jgi:quercetin dioxygenase-like cupin family protein